MTVIPGVEIQQDAEGVATHISIDLRENPDVIPILKEAGLIPRTREELKDELATASSVDEVFDRLEKKIVNHYAKRRNNSTC